MRRMTAITLAAAGLFALAGAGKFERLTLPDSAKGPFVQRKTLADVGVTLTSSGEYEFEKDRFFALRTLKPIASSFIATPTNYTLQAGGKTTTRPIAVDISSLESIFKIREVKSFVKDVQVKGTNFPYIVSVLYKNGDKLEIDLNQ